MVLVESGSFYRPAGYVRREVSFAYGYEGRKSEKPIGIKPKDVEERERRRRSSKLIPYKARSVTAPKEVHYVIQPRIRPGRIKVK